MKTLQRAPSAKSFASSTWDSRFGENYRYAVQGELPSNVDYPVTRRTGRRT
jgi:hypothetical protein